MAAEEMQVTSLVSGFLPAGAKLMTIEKPAPHTAIHLADLTGDGIPEIAAVYRLNGEMHLLVLTYRDGVWQKAAAVKGTGYAVTLLSSAPVLRAGLDNLLVGWQIGSIWSKLSVYEWTPEGLKDAAPADMSYSYIEVGDMPGLAGRDGKAEVALWIHDTGEAYSVQVLRWSNGAFVPAPDVYPYYFPRVVRYYEAMTRRHPDYTFYWYYLADAQYRAGLPEAALVSVRKALSFPNPFPSREKLLELRLNILAALGRSPEARMPALLPASLKTTSGLKWGYIDPDGRLAIRPIYEDAADFQQNGLAVVGKNGKYGLIDRSAHFVVPPVYDSIHPFSGRRAVVIDGEGFKLIDEKGKVLTGRAYSFIADMEDGRAVFYVTEGGSGDTGTSRYGYLDVQGREVIPAQYEEANEFHGGRAVVKIRDGDYALIASDGRKLVSYPYAYVGPHGDGLLAFQQTSGGKYGYIDERGKVVIAPSFTVGLPFHDGRAVVSTSADYKWTYGVIDKTGRYVIKPAYNDIRDLGEKRFALGRALDPEQPFLGSVYAIADWNGAQLSDFLYDEVSGFKDGLASVAGAEQTYFVNRGGKPAPGYPRVEGSGSLALERGGLIKAYTDRRLAYLNRTGKVIWQQNTVISLAPPYAVREGKYKPNRDYLVYYPQVEGMKDGTAQRTVNDRLKEWSQVKPVPGDRKLDYSYSGDFEVAFYKEKLLELELTGYKYPFGAAHGMPSKTYAILNLENGRMYALKDLFKPGSDYVRILSAIVGRQIKEDPQYAYVFTDSYTGIKPDQPFYVTEDALHLYFFPYDIGPYAAGFPTFTIPFARIGAIVDREGEFWKAFHA
ncbi:WG repeat-containing protein [Paenibacillus chitinolyticus]|uniref:WG repeat-containing protein n=1 Tax=Paenibacillus chitinolyticus TaxID=79263 RepID=UPI002DBE2EE9|nr:WG repeat-containing protein [Paenibacillus chitinolyticus]MEC0249225.1 WG repeat-containing protein [Paenibacillus chitinolyticus]